MAERQIEIRTLKVGHYIIIDSEPCKVVSMAVSKTGKHGSTKARIEAVGLIDERKRFLIKPTSDRIEVPIIEKRRAQVMNVSGNIVTFMDLTDYSTKEGTIPEDLKDKIDVGKELEYWIIGNKFIIKDAR